VTTIGGAAFENCTSLTSVTIGNSVTTIGARAFWGCIGLTEVIIPNSVTTIGEEAFGYCTGLTSVTIGNSVTTIERWAFENCTGLTSVIIPNSVTTIGNRAFWGCDGLTSITIGNSVTTIGSGAFGGRTTSLLRKVTNLATAPQSIGLFSEMFPVSPFLLLLYVPPEAIDAYKSAPIWRDFGRILAIGDCISDTVEGFTWSICNDVLTIGGEGAMPRSIPWGIYHHLVSTVIIQDGVTTIGSGAFWFFTGLTSVTIPNSVTTIEQRAFGYCTGLTEITIPNSVTTIRDRAFEMTGLTEVVNLADIPQWIDSSTFPNIHNIRLTVLGTAIDAYKTADVWRDFGEILPINYYDGCQGGIWGLSGPTTWCISDGTLTISGEGAMRNYGWDIIAGHVHTPPWMAHQNLFTAVIIENGVTSIGDWAFQYCTDLTSITIGNSVTTIGVGAFLGCTGLTEVTIPNSVTTIERLAFRGCTGLTSVIIGNSVTTIGLEAFRDCTGLTSVTIGNSVTTIGWAAFRGCIGLREVVNYANIPQVINSSVFEDIPNMHSITLLVPFQAIEAYKAADRWRNWGDFNIKGICEERGHSWELTTIAATCEKDGEQADVCSVCGEKKNIIILMALGHDMPDTWSLKTAATCLTDRVEEKVCARDGCTHAQEQIVLGTATGHNWQPTAIPATCTIAGEEAELCFVCGEKRNVVTLPALGHDHRGAAATCTTPQICARNGCEHVISPAMEHNLPETWTQRTAATCVTAGLEFRTCTHTGCTHEVTRPISAREHLLGAWTVRIEPTCTTPGDSIITCTRTGCNHIGDTKAGTALGHSWGTWVNNPAVTEIPATCLIEGSRGERAPCTRTCGVADTTRIVVIPMLTGEQCATSIREKNTDTRHGIILDPAVATNSAKISVKTPEQATITLRILDNLGNVVFETNGRSDETFTWNLTNNAGRFVGNGTYLVVVEATGISGKRFTYSARLGVNR
jgi:hypothetical protein